MGWVLWEIILRKITGGNGELIKITTMKKRDFWCNPWSSNLRSFFYITVPFHLPTFHEKKWKEMTGSNEAKGLMFSIGYLICEDCIWANWYLNCKLKRFVQRPLLEDRDYNIPFILFFFSCPRQKWYHLLQRETNRILSSRLFSAQCKMLKLYTWLQNVSWWGDDNLT